MPAGGTTITFLSDFGLSDPFVGVCHAVIARLAPSATVIDLTHGVSPRDVQAAAVTLADCIGYLPTGVHLAVVDPGVGTARAGVVVEAGGHLLVGPDNGLLVPAAERLGGVGGLWELKAPAYRLAPVSKTFHGRDVFAPAAAHLASGVAPAALGPARDLGDLVRLTLPSPLSSEDQVSGEVVLVDRFGNAALNVLESDLAAAGLQEGDRIAVRADSGSADATVAGTFADVAAGELAVLVDSFGRAALAVNGGDAAELLSAQHGTHITLSRRPD